MRRSRSEVHEEWTIGRNGFLRSHPGHAIICEVCCEVITLFRAGWRFNGNGVPEQSRVELVRFSSHEAIEVIETQSGGPVGEWSGCAGVVVWSVVVLAPPSGSVSVGREYLGNGSATSREDSAIAGITCRHFLDYSG